MADNIQLKVRNRDEFGKGAARRIRREDRIPAVLYAHGDEPAHITLDGHATMMALKNPNALLEIVNEDTGDTKLAIARDVQREPIRRFIEHVDLIIVKRGQKIEVEVPVIVEGEAAPETLVSVDNQTLLVEADATKIPESFEINIEGREVGEHVYASEVTLPAGVSLVSDPELLVVNISAELSEEQLEAELESDAVEETPAEGDEAAETESEEGSEQESEGEGDSEEE